MCPEQPHQPHVTDPLAAPIGEPEDVRIPAKRERPQDEPSVLRDDRTDRGVPLQQGGDLLDPDEEVPQPLLLTIPDEPLLVPPRVRHEVLMEEDPARHLARCSSPPQSRHRGGVVGAQSLPARRSSGAVSDGLSRRPRPVTLPALGAGELLVLSELVEVLADDGAKGTRERHAPRARVRLRAVPQRRREADRQRVVAPGASRVRPRRLRLDGPECSRSVYITSAETAVDALRPTFAEPLRGASDVVGPALYCV